MAKKKKTEEEEAICLADNIVIISKISRETFCNLERPSTKSFIKLVHFRKATLYKKSNMVVAF